MEVNLNKAKQEFMNIVKRKLKIMAIKVVAVISIIVMLACFCYVIWDATIGKAIDVFGNTITSLAKIFSNESGSKLEIDSGDLEDNLVKELEAMNLDVDTLNIGTKEGDKDEKLKYLKKYLAAEVVTLYPNVSVDQGLFKRDLQGIVTIEKLTANGLAQKLKYKGYDDFKEDLESGDSDVNNYFTINSNNDVIVAKRTVENDVTTYSEQKIEYQNTISGYTMPFEFLLSLAQITQNPEYVAAVADLIIKESEIKVTVFETKTTTTTVETLYYTNNKKKIPVSEATAGSVTEPTIEQETDKSEEIQRTVKEEYTLSTDVTYARVWCGIKKIDEISITENEPTTTPSELSEAPEYIEEEPATEGEWKTDAKKQTIQTIQSQTKKVGQATSEIDTELFMGLWKNSTGKYEKTDFNSDGTMTNQAAKYDKNGKKVKYEVEERGTKEAPIDNILSAPEMLFEFLEKSERTQKQEDFLKYCLYLYTGTDYGVTSLEFSIFDAGSFKSMGSIGGIAMFKEWLHTWEGHEGISEDGTKYRVGDDGAGHPTVGYGVDIYNSGFLDRFLAAGYSVEEGSWIDKDFVDALENEEIANCMQEIREKTVGLDLTEYQIYALVSRAYNCGISGAFDKYYNGMNFKQAYNNYWNQERDLKYSGTASFDNGLYTYYMNKPVTSNGEYLPGLERRRESEWKLFSTGYLDNIDKYWVEYNDGDTVEEEGDGYSSIVSFGGKQYREYKQAKGSYSTQRYSAGNIASSGCGPTSLAIIVSGYGHNNNPAEIGVMMNYGPTGDALLTSTLKNKFNINCTNSGWNNCNKEIFINNLLQGRPVVVSVNGRANNLFTNSSHIMAVLGIRNNNQEVYISNPSSKATGWQKLDDLWAVIDYHITIEQ